MAASVLPMVLAAAAAHASWYAIANAILTTGMDAGLHSRRREEGGDVTGAVR